MRTFADFVADDRLHIRSEWVEERPNGVPLRLYVRKCIRWPGAIELANMEVTHPEHLGKGSLTSFLDTWEDQLPMLVENVLNPRLPGYLERRGWVFFGKNDLSVFLNPLLQAQASNA